MTDAPPSPWERPANVPTRHEHRFPCDECGGDMRFDPGGDQLVCDHCGNVEKLGRHLVETIDEIAIGQGLGAGGAETEETQVTDCPNCGARFEFDPAIHAAECPFCATPVVADTGIDRHIKPGALVPFKLQERDAHRAMTEWLGGLWFAPNGLKRYARHNETLKGIYVPFWTFDAQSDTVYSGARGDTYYVTKTVIRDGKPQRVQVPKIRWTPKRGRVRRFFDDVLILASSSLPKSHTDALEPWDLSGLAPYAPQYIAGFRAEAYRVSLEDGLVEARRRMDAVIARDIRMDIGGDRQRVDHAETTFSDVTFKHVLLPIWIAAYKYRGRSFRFVVNGQTGRVRGERPFSTWKIAAAVIAGLVVALAAGYVYALMEGGGGLPSGGFGGPGWLND